MKKLLFAMIASLSLILASCNDDDDKNDDKKATGIDNNSEDDRDPHDFNDMVIDYAPIIIRFHVVDPTHQTNFVSDNYNDIIHTTTLTYQGKTYSVENKISKYYMPFFDGLTFDSSAVDQPFFSFGELDGGDNFDDDFVITFADGSTETIHFKRVHKGGLSIDDTWTLNGEKCYGGSFIIYREKQDDGSIAKPKATNNTQTGVSPIKLKFYVAEYGMRTHNYVAENFNDIVHNAKLTFRGKTYSVGQTVQDADATNFKGLYIDSTALKKPYFCFGELDGNVDYDDDFVIDLADGEPGIIHLKHKAGSNGGDTWTFNGKESNNSPVFFRQVEDGKLISLHLDWE